MKIVRKIFFNKKISNFLFVLSFIIIQSCCNISTQSDMRSENNQYIGEWYSVYKGIPFSATLVIDSNYTFNYEGGACVIRFGSEGYWACNGDTLLLNSYEPEECYYLFEFDAVCMEFDINDSTTYLKPQFTKEGCTPENQWYEYVKFKNVKFLIIDSVLTHIPLCLEVENEFTRTKPVYD